MKKSDLGKSVKVQRIIMVAQQLFGLYGIEKTSMQEIADDLKLSKASLYYYFPDKESLYRAVVEKEHSEFITKIEMRILNIREPELLLREFAIARLTYFRTLLNLSRLRLEDYSDLKPIFRETNQIFKEKEEEIVSNILGKGISEGLFSIKDPDQTASLFLEILKALRISALNGKNTMILEQDEYEHLLKNTIEFTELITNGLKIK